jgi:hypothetical protein
VPAARERIQHAARRLLAARGHEIAVDRELCERDARAARGRRLGADVQHGERSPQRVEQQREHPHPSIVEGG